MILLLAGTGEARDIADGLARRGVAARARLSGATRSHRALAIPCERGGFGGAAGFQDYLLTHHIRAVIDATHPFAAQISSRAAQICGALNVPCVHVLRPGWLAGPRDRWRMISGAAEVAAIVPEGKRVFLATGRQTLEGFRNLGGRRLFMRQIDPPGAPFPWENGEYIIGRPPFSLGDEKQLFEALKIDYLVVKNAGGQASRSKLDAARDLGIEVLMLRRPPAPKGRLVETSAEALAWVARL